MFKIFSLVMAAGGVGILWLIGLTQMIMAVLFGVLPPQEEIALIVLGENLILIPLILAVCGFVWIYRQEPMV